MDTIKLPRSDVRRHDMPHILIIEDDAVTALEIATELGCRGHHAHWMNEGTAALASALREPYDAITLDRMLPGIDGLTLVAMLREHGIHIPVLMISALSDVDERVRGLRAGGDDYLTKPFASDEMAARIEALLRRRQASSHTGAVLKLADLTLDLLARTACRDSHELILLPTEFKLLEFMMRNAGHTLTRMMIFESVWGYHFDPGTNLIDVHIGRLRRKLDAPGKPPLIRTVRGTGYVLTDAY